MSEDSLIRGVINPLDAPFGFVLATVETFRRELQTPSCQGSYKLNPLNFPDRDFHPAKNDKLCLSHKA
jgi:hypothetical protein